MVLGGLTNVRFGSKPDILAAFNGCLLYPRKRTSFGTAVMSVPCHKQTFGQL